jgi:hypothetical protein
MLVRRLFELVENETPDAEETTTKNGTLEETVIQWFITIALPLIIAGVAFGVIILAFSGWKLY